MPATVQTLIFSPSRGKDHKASNQVPERFIQKKRVEMTEALISRESVSGVDVDSPGQAGGVTVKFLVEKVAPSAYCLSRMTLGARISSHRGVLSFFHLV